MSKRIIRVFVVLVFSSVSWLCLAANETSRTISQQKIMPSDQVIPVLLGLLVTLVIIVALAFLLKKISRVNFHSSHIKVVESQNLGNKEKLMVVELQGEQYLIGVTPYSIHQLCQLKENIIPQKSSLSFEQMMKQLLSARPMQSGEDKK
ncbi:MAG: flagellar biosynthetic protein FliO [Gammaproteobacteria bacterium]|nr:flagellar biosynthetic protein FliO [Gammaproteobacteria bacterium]MDH5629970.1 flagellar biosynthetic protein FliO [Gammaproteobacteria bacterium]